MRVWLPVLPHKKVEHNKIVRLISHFNGMWSGQFEMKCYLRSYLVVFQSNLCIMVILVRIYWKISKLAVDQSNCVFLFDVVWIVCYTWRVWSEFYKNWPGCKHFFFSVLLGAYIVLHGDTSHFSHRTGMRYAMWAWITCLTV